MGSFQQAAARCYFYAFAARLGEVCKHRLQYLLVDRVRSVANGSVRCGLDEVGHVTPLEAKMTKHNRLHTPCEVTIRWRRESYKRPPTRNGTTRAANDSFQLSAYPCDLSIGLASAPAFDVGLVRDRCVAVLNVYLAFPAAGGVGSSRAS
jgi:hypothetical protein